MILTEMLPTGRWKLLKALWMDGTTGSVRALARQYRMGYSSAHAELKRLERASLACSTVIGNSLVYRANMDHPVADAVLVLVRASTHASSTRAGRDPSRRVMANLISLGAPLRAETTPTTDMAPEDAVAQGLRLTHRHPTLVRAYPVLLARNRNRLNMERLKQKATALNEKNTLGFFLELTGMLTNDRGLRSFAQTLKDRRIKKVRDFFESRQGKYSEYLASRRTLQVAKDWHFRMDMDMENFRQFYSKFCHA